MKLQQPPVDTEWRIVNSRILHHPSKINADDLPELRSRVAEIIRIGNQHRETKKRIKGLSFKYEVDDRDYVSAVHVYFEGYTGKIIRAMKLERA